MCVCVFIRARGFPMTPSILMSSFSLVSHNSKGWHNKAASDGCIPTVSTAKPL